jgi:serine/threonine protein kinase
MAIEREKRAALALVIGVGHYRLDGRIGTLPFAVADAVAVEKALVDPRGCGFPEDGVTLLTDADATRDEVVRKLSKWLPEAARKAEIVVIYFAGHGRRLGSGNESAFLMPYDADPDDLVTKGIELGDLRRWIDRINARSVVLCLDCCHSGKIFSRDVSGKIIARDVDASRATARDIGIGPSALERFSTNDSSGKGIFVISACGEGQFAHEMADLGHGLFTHHLLRGIEQGARDEDGAVRLSNLFEYVSEEVRRDAERKFSVVQKPWYNVTGSGAVFLTKPRAPAFTEKSEEVRIAEFERGYPSADDAELIRGLRGLKAMTTPGRFPAIIRCHSHPSEVVRARAKATRDAIGWDAIAEGIEALAGQLDDEHAGHVLAGLKAIKAEPPVVALLERLTERFKGASSILAFRLVEQKRLAVDMDAIVELFRERKSPYQIRKVLGQGLFAAAYLARDESSEMDVVVRILRRRFVHQSEVRAQFVSLSRRCITLSHHNLVSTRDVGDFRDRDVFFSVRKYVDGDTLRTWFESGRRFRPAEIVSMLGQVADALNALHEEGIIHGGIKPSNLFVTKKDRVILGDPSLTIRVIGEAPERLAYDYRYAPPELFEPPEELEPRSDFYSLGCVAYELACQAPPHVSDNPHDLVERHRKGEIVHPSRKGSRLGRSGDDLIARLLARSPDDRPADADALIREIDLVRDSLRQSPSGWQFPPSGLGESIGDLRDFQSLVDFRPGPEPDESGEWEPDDPPDRPPEAKPVGGSAGPSPVEPAGPSRRPPDAPSRPGSADPSPPEDPMGPARTFFPSRLPDPSPDAGAGHSATFLPRSGPSWPSEPRSGHASPPDPPMEEAQETPIEGPGTDAEIVYPMPPGEPADDEVPRRIGRYVIHRVIGKGGMGTVYLAHDLVLDRLVALKVPHRRLARDPDVRARFLREARAAALFAHPSFCPIFDTGEVDGLPYLTMAYIEGGTLASAIVKGRPWDQRRAAEVARQLADALAEAHRRGVIHRDLKPANVMIDSRGALVIMDFGLAFRFRVEDTKLTAAGVLLGTPAYMSPEQAEGNTMTIGPRSDLYSLGVILYELLTGRRPFEGPMAKVLGMIAFVDPEAPSTLHPGLDRALEGICLKAMAKRPDDRFDSMDQFADALRAWSDGQEAATPGPSNPLPDKGRPDPAPPDRTLGEPASPFSRSRLVSAAIVSAVILVILWLLYLTLRR